MYLDKLIAKAKKQKITPEDVVMLINNFEFEIYNSGYCLELKQFLEILKENHEEVLLNIIDNATFDTNLFHLMVLKYNYIDRCHNEQYLNNLTKNVNVINYKLFNELLKLLPEAKANEYIDFYVASANTNDFYQGDMDIDYLMSNYDKINSSLKNTVINLAKRKIANNSNYKFKVKSFDKKIYDDFQDNLDNITYLDISYADIIAMLNDIMRKAACIQIGKTTNTFDFSDRSLNVIYNYLSSINEEYVVSPVAYILKDAIAKSISNDNKKEIFVTEDNFHYIDSVINNGNKSKCIIGYKEAVKHFDSLNKIINKDKIEIDFFGLRPNMPLEKFLHYYNSLIDTIENNFFTELEKYIYIYSFVKNSKNRLLDMNILMNLCNIPSKPIVTYDKKTSEYKGYNLSHIKDVKYKIDTLFASDPENETSINNDFSTYEKAFIPYEDIANETDIGIKKFNGLAKIGKGQAKSRTLDKAFNYVNKVINPDMNDDRSAALINLVFVKSNIPIPIDGNITIEKGLNYGPELFADLFSVPSIMNFDLKNCQQKDQTNEIVFTYSMAINGLPNSYIVEAINRLFITDGIFFTGYSVASKNLDIELYVDKNIAIKDFISYVDNKLNEIINSLLDLKYLVKESQEKTRKK